MSDNWLIQPFLDTSRFGFIQANNANLSISNATECIIVISAATDFSWPDIAKRGPDPLPVARNSSKKAAAIGWNELLKAHADDYHSFFSRCRLKFMSGTQNSKSNLTTIERLRQYQQGRSDPAPLIVEPHEACSPGAVNFQGLDITCATQPSEL